LIGTRWRHDIGFSKSKPLLRRNPPGRAILGHDGAMEATFFVTEDVLKRVQPDMRPDK